MKKLISTLTMLLGLAFFAGAAEKTLTLHQAPAWPPSESLLRETQAGMDRAVRWLANQQNEDGSWSDTQFPALTALPLWALLDAGWDDKDGIDRAVAFLLSRARENGAIFSDPNEDRKGGGLTNYNTALAMVALHKTGRPELVPTVLKAREFVAASQHFGGDIYHGGMGYDATTRRARGPSPTEGSPRIPWIADR